MFDVIIWKYIIFLKIFGQYFISIGKENLDGYFKYIEIGRYLLFEGKVVIVLVLSSGKLERIFEIDLVDFESGENLIIIFIEILFSDT